MSVTPRRRQPSLPFALAAVLGVGVLSTAANALGLLVPGPTSGEEPPGAVIVLLVVSTTLALGGFVLLVAGAIPAASRHIAESRWFPAVGAATSCFVVARYLSYDDYAAPTLLRFSETRPGLAGFVVAVAVLGALAALGSRWWPLASLLMTGVAMWLTLFASFVVTIGN